MKLQVHPDESFGLKFDFTPARAFNSYLWQLQDESGRALMERTLPGNSLNHEVVLAVP